MARDWKDGDVRESKVPTNGLLGRTASRLLPTPVVNDMGAGKTPGEWDAWTEKMRAKHNNGNGHGRSLAIEAQRLLPTPCVADGTGGHLTRGGDRSNELLLPGVAKSIWAQRIGASTPPPSNAGHTSSDDPPRLPLTTEVTLFSDEIWDT
jgi:hypothetical protein